MNTREKIEKAGNTAILCLHKEGAFCKVYNQHAMLFIEHIKPLKVAVKFVKIVNQHVYSAGFPLSSLEDIKKEVLLLGRNIEETDNGFPGNA